MHSPLMHFVSVHLPSTQDVCFETPKVVPAMLVVFVHPSSVHDWQSLPPVQVIVVPSGGKVEPGIMSSCWSLLDDGAAALGHDPEDHNSDGPRRSSREERT